ncbi:TetR/AcrR family transcriptional regulator [Streptomyces mobaraensis NBRC 13819 = DSM 40847]|uniref:TetR/AcrR family transcriptional regulator n=2 Tax=Streptomyces mobaraensis TaxID=35621 RepID=A0A5N5W3Q4_STRMB|nr:TetR/AcrR family transcriptional regulator [Streptomyces mobaraensis]EME97400.1 transcriptional regulator [Streptomyces mobaraensis NBRC 13819 = DSM 40847]KAB7838174.1 TetR/AcrR family transcriptional regulator [Streptomyces mobaraensis]QTT77415.1 TetR/AcrR family transcriptional regulator [Streptomyces mobaraensis NBRC 13819 = DSM 40847]
MPKVSDAHLQARRREILDAAATCFARDGFHRTSMQDIVRESGISAGLIYRYFAGKDDMIAAIVTEWHEHRATLIDAARGAEQAPDADRLFSVYLDLLRSVGRPETAQDLHLGLQVWAETIRTPRIRELARHGVDGPRAAAAETIRSAAQHGKLPTHLDADAFARILIAVYQGLMLQTAWDDTVDNEAFVRAVETTLTALTRR